MKYMTAGCAALALVLTLASNQAFAQGGPAGVWDLSVETPQGPNPATLKLTLNGDALTGDMVSQMGVMPVSGTSSSSGAMALTATIDMQGASFKILINGTIAGDAVSGSVKFGDFGEFPFTGTRTADNVAGADALPAAASAASASFPLPATSGAPVEVGGKWDVVLTVAGLGDIVGTMTLAQDGGNVTGVLASQIGEIKVSGTVTGATLTLNFLAATPMGPIPISMTGELGAGGFAGKASVAGMGEASWKATRGK